MIKLLLKLIEVLLQMLFGINANLTGSNPSASAGNAFSFDDMTSPTATNASPQQSNNIQAAASQQDLPMNSFDSSYANYPNTSEDPLAFLLSNDNVINPQPQSYGQDSQQSQSYSNNTNEVSIEPNGQNGVSIVSDGPVVSYVDGQGNLSVNGQDTAINVGAQQTFQPSEMSAQYNQPNEQMDQLEQQAQQRAEKLEQQAQQRAEKLQQQAQQRAEKLEQQAQQRAEKLEQQAQQRQEKLEQQDQLRADNSELQPQQNSTFTLPQGAKAVTISGASGVSVVTQGDKVTVTSDNPVNTSVDEQGVTISGQQSSDNQQKKNDDFELEPLNSGSPDNLDNQSTKKI